MYSDKQNILNSEMERSMRRLMENNCALIIIFSNHVGLNYIFCCCR